MRVRAPPRHAVLTAPPAPPPCSATLLRHATHHRSSTTRATHTTSTLMASRRSGSAQRLMRASRLPLVDAAGEALAACSLKLWIVGVAWRGDTPSCCRCSGSS